MSDISMIAPTQPFVNSTLSPATEGQLQTLPLQGTFEEVRFATLISLCRQQRFTGALHTQAGNTRSIFIRQGMPVACLSNEPGEKIGRILVAQGRISDAQYMKAAMLMVERSIKLTDALVELGLVDSQSLIAEQRNLTRDQIIQCFEWTSGKFTVAEGQQQDSSVPHFEFSLGEIFIQGYRQYAPMADMQTGYDRLREQYLQVNADFHTNKQQLQLSMENERVLFLLGSAMTLEEVVQEAEQTSDNVARIIAPLMSLGYLEVFSPTADQFRLRLRAERERYNEKVAKVREASQTQEARLLAAFELALQKLGGSPMTLSLPSEQQSIVSNSATASAPVIQESYGLPRKDSSFVFVPSIEKGSLKDRTSSSELKQQVSSSTHSEFVAVTGNPFIAQESPVTSVGNVEKSSFVDPIHSVLPLENQAPPNSTMIAFAASAAEPIPTSTAKATSGVISESSEEFLQKPSTDTLQKSDIAKAAVPNVQQNPTEFAASRFQEGQRLAQENRLDEAELVLREALRVDASKPEYLLGLARVLLTNPKYDRLGTLPVVKSLLDRAVQLQPQHEEAVIMHQNIVRELADIG